MAYFVTLMQESEHDLERRSATKLVQKVEQVDEFDPNVVHDEDYFKRLQNSASHRFESRCIYKGGYFVNNKFCLFSIFCFTIHMKTNLTDK